VSDDEREDLRRRLVAVLDPCEVVDASDGERSLRVRTADELADAALIALGGSRVVVNVHDLVDVLYHGVWDSDPNGARARLRTAAEGAPGYVAPY
jgi:hypothetical protein